MPLKEASKPNCETKRRLADEFATAARLFAEAVVLFTCRDSRSKDEYNRLRNASRAAQEQAEIARIAFEEHVDSHGCG
jgi:hypothetical protein